MKKSLKIFGTLIATLSVSLTTLVSASAWGPERATFTMNSPATYPTFNSITDNPTIGDERDFVRVGEINADVTSMKNEIEVVPGRQYLVYIYFHNNASATFNDSAHNHSGVAVRTRMSSAFSTVLTPSEKGTISATITADNTNPLSVWDEAYMTTKTDKTFLHYVPGSAKIYNDWKANGSVMPSSLFTKEGTLVGLNALNGVIPGCEEYHGIVTYVLQAEELGGTIDKKVSKDGKEFGEAINLAPGEEATFELTIRNTGDVELTNATIKDTLPTGLTLVPGSVRLRANDSTVEDELSDNIIGTGYNLGTIGTGNVVYITYRAVADGDFDCKGTELLNNAVLIYDSDKSEGENKEDSATVIVKRTDCDEPENPPLDDCETNPSLPGCQDDCVTNPELPECQELPNTGPLEIIMAIIIVLGIAGGGYYLYKTKRTLKSVEKNVSGKDVEESKKAEAPEKVDKKEVEKEDLEALKKAENKTEKTK